MRNSTLLATVILGAALAGAARADIIDNFDGYADQAAFASAWTIDTGTLNLQSTLSYDAPNAVAWASSSAARAHRAVGGAGIAASSLDWSFQYYDNNATRDFNCLYAYSGGWGSGLQTVLAMGDYNTVSGKYMARYSAISGVQYADGAVSDGGTGGWFSLNVARTTGAWHLMEVKGSTDPANAGKVKLEFYVDNTLAGSISGVADYNFTWATIGGALSVGTTGGATDDYRVSVVPEPSAAALSLLGGLVLALSNIYRRSRG